MRVFVSRVHKIMAIWKDDCERCIDVFGLRVYNVAFWKNVTVNDVSMSLVEG